MPILVVFALLVLAVAVVVLLLIHESGSHREHPVLISCPHTFDLAPTGVEVANVQDVDEHNVLVDCPACGNDHEWGPDDAVLIDRQR